MPESFTPADRAWQSRTSWGVEIGRLKLAVTRTREQRPLNPIVESPVSSRRSSFAAGAFTGIGAVALLVAGASASPRPAGSMPYLVSVPVPAPAVRHIARAERSPEVGRSPSRLVTPVAEAPSDDTFDDADKRHVTRAMATGGLQEWEDEWGQRRFLTAGPARVEGGRACRDLALLIRMADGGSEVRSTERCAAVKGAPRQPREDGFGDLDPFDAEATTQE